MNYGTKHGFEKFFHMNNINGKPFIPGYNQATHKQCPIIDIVGCTDGSGIPPYTKKTDKINFYQHMLPIPYPTYYKKSLRRGILDVYEFAIDDAIYVRSNVTGLDCFAETGNVVLPDGLIDTSAINYGKCLKFISI